MGKHIITLEIEHPYASKDGLTIEEVWEAIQYKDDDRKHPYTVRIIPHPVEHLQPEVEKRLTHLETLLTKLDKLQSTLRHFSKDTALVGIFDACWGFGESARMLGEIINPSLNSPESPPSKEIHPPSQPKIN